MSSVSKIQSLRLKFSSESKTTLRRLLSIVEWSQTEHRVIDSDVRSLEEFINFKLAQKKYLALGGGARKFEGFPDFFTKTIDSLTDSAPVALIGAGKMGSSILESWLSVGVKRDSIVVVEPKPVQSLIDTTRREGITLCTHVRDLKPVSVLFLAIKPQEADSALKYFRHFVGNNTLVISIMAGKTLGFISSKLERRAAIVRAMPNITATVGMSATAAVANDLVNERHKKLAFLLLRTAGSVQWIKEEGLMDAVTALSGSGPAYVFLLAEALARAGIAAGLSPDLATKLARETVAGSGELLHRSELDSATLRQNVTSPGGTTAAALEVLMGPDGMQSLLTRAVAAATKRSRELAE
jgi:pyrroline-5-carboxylate reductase